MATTTPLPPTAQEQRAVFHFRQLRSRVHAGPYYTQGRAQKRNPFEMPTYTQKYRRPNLTVPKLEGPFPAKRFFPKELHPIMEGHSSHTKKRQKIESSSHQDKKKPKVDVSRRRRIEAVAAEATEEAGDEQPEEEVDDDFEENESEAGGDYNAEAYFDDGDEGEDGGGDEGEGGGEGSY